MDMGAYSFLCLLYLILFFFFNFIKVKKNVVVLFFIFLYFSSAFSVSFINDDSVNYSFYFLDVYNHEDFYSLYYDHEWAKMEVGFKILLYFVSSFSPGGDFSFKFILLVFNLMPLYFLFKNKENKLLSASFFSFFFVCFYFYMHNLAIISYSMSSFWVLLMFDSLFFYNGSWRVGLILLCLIFSGAFHYAGLFFCFLILFFYFLNRFSSNFLIGMSFFSVLIFPPMAKYMASYLGEYYVEIFSSASGFVFSPNMLVQVFVVVVFCLKCSVDSFGGVGLFSLKLILCLMLFCSLVEFYLGVAALGRLSMLSFMLFLYWVSLYWSYMKFSLKFFLTLFSTLYFLLSTFLVNSAW